MPLHIATRITRRDVISERAVNRSRMNYLRSLAKVREDNTLSTLFCACSLAALGAGLLAQVVF